MSNEYSPISINLETFNDTGRVKKYQERWDFARDQFRKDKSFREQVVKSYLAIRDVGASAVHSNTFLQNMSVHYANGEFIGEQLMPVVSVDKRSDNYATYPKREIFAYPDDAIAQRGRANEISESRGSDNYSVKDYGFSDFVSTDTVDNQDAVFDEMKDCMEKPLYALALKREQRIATIVTTGANFAGNTSTPAVLWDTASPTIVANIQTAIASTFRGAGDSELIGFTSIDVWNVMSRDAGLRDLFKYVKEGLAMPQQIAQYLGLSRILVSDARQDTANSGQASATYSRIFGKNFGILRVAKSPTKRSAHFGSTFRLRNMPLATQWFDPSLGTKGGTWCKQACSEDHKIVAPDTSYLLTGVIS